MFLIRQPSKFDTPFIRVHNVLLGMMINNYGAVERFDGLEHSSAANELITFLLKLLWSPFNGESLFDSRLLLWILVQIKLDKKNH